MTRRRTGPLKSAVRPPFRRAFKMGRCPGGSACLEAEVMWNRLSHATVAIDIRALAFDGAVHYTCAIHQDRSWSPLGEASWKGSAQEAVDGAWASLVVDWGEIGGRVGRALKRLPRKVTEAQETRLRRAEARDVRAAEARRKKRKKRRRPFRGVRVRRDASGRRHYSYWSPA